MSVQRVTRAIFNCYSRLKVKSIHPWSRARALVLVDRAGGYASFWPTLSSLSMAHISPHNRTEAQRVVAFPETPRFFPQELASGRKGVEGALSRCTYRFARHCHRSRAPIITSQYYIATSVEDRLCHYGKGVLCVATCAAGFVPLIKRLPRRSSAFARVFCGSLLPPFTQTARASLSLFNIYVYTLPRRDNLALSHQGALVF